MKLSLTISTLAHAMLLACGLLWFSVKPFEAATVEALPVDVISSSEFSQITAGVKTAPKAETPKPLVEKVAPDPKPVKDVTPKVSEKPEVETNQENAPPPTPQVKETPPKPEEKKPDEIAEALKKEQVKPPPTPPKKPPPPKLDMSKIENKLALLDKREQRRAAATADAPLNNTPTLGTPMGRAASLSQSEIDALRAQIQACWNPPAGAADARDLIVKVRLMLNQDGTLSGEPTVVNNGSGAFQIAAESAMRAIRRCQPYRLPIAKYDVWKDVEVTFDPRDMYRG